jgi:hypothetical protein
MIAFGRRPFVLQQLVNTALGVEVFDQASSRAQQHCGSGAFPKALGEASEQAHQLSHAAGPASVAPVCFMVHAHRAYFEDEIGLATG